jgi:outer membrane protein OmpA-like peptidoglycan-associated protein
MRRILAIFLTILIFSSFSIILAQPDRAGSKDPPLFNRMPDYWIQLYDEKDFFRFEFPTGKNQTNAVEGHYYMVKYFLNSGAKPAGSVAIMRNYQNAVKSIGGQIIYQAPDYWQTVLKVVRNGSEYWTLVRMMNSQDYSVIMVQKALMAQNIVITAQDIAKNIKETGKASLFGLYFDTNKAEIKPESEPALQEIAKYLKMEPKLKFYVVGHTDNVGTLEFNLKLSKDRADAVVKELTGKYEIPAAQLTAWGDGPTAPVASNAAEEGRAQNRRVELVAQ